METSKIKNIFMGFLDRFFGRREEEVGPPPAPPADDESEVVAKAGEEEGVEDITPEYEALRIAEEPQDRGDVAARREVVQTADAYLATLESGEGNKSVERVANERLEAAAAKFGAFKDKITAGFSRVADKLGYAAKIGIFAPDVLATRAGEAVVSSAKRGMKKAAGAVERGASAATEEINYGAYLVGHRAKEAAAAIGDFAWKSGGREAAELGYGLGEAARVMSTGETWKKLGRAALEKAQGFGAGVKYIAADLPKDEINKYCIARTGATSGELWGEGKETVARVLGEVQDSAASKYDAAAEWTVIKTADLALKARKSYLRMEQRVTDARGWASKRVEEWKKDRQEAQIRRALAELEAKKAACEKLLGQFLGDGNA